MNYLFVFLLALSCSIVNTKAFNHDSTIYNIRSFLYTFDDIEADVIYLRDLKNINNNSNFKLYEIESLRYAIISKPNSNIVDIQFGDIPDENNIYYLGPGNFKSELVAEKISADDENSIKRATEAILNEEPVNFNFVSETQTKGKLYPTKPSEIAGGSEIGISESRFNLFTNNVWIVRGDTCESYMGAAMVSYMDKYFGGNYIKEKYTISSSAQYGNYIINRFKQYIGGPVTTFKVLNTIFMSDYPKSGKTGATTTKSTYKSKIKGGRPMIFLLKTNAPGNTYGGHFVLAYRYVDYNGRLWFKAYDGWEGYNLKGWINRNWISNGIYPN